LLSDPVIIRLKADVVDLREQIQHLKHSVTNMQDIGKMVLRKIEVNESLHGLVPVLLQCVKEPLPVLQLPTLGAEEIEHQTWFLQLVKTFASPHHVIDTSVKGYVHNPSAKFDILISRRDPPTWSDIVSFGEVNSDISNGPGFETIVGRLQHRCTHLFTLQPDRHYTVCFGASANHIFFAHVTRTRQWTVTPTRNLKDAVPLLKGLVAAPPTALGFVEHVSLLASLPLPLLLRKPDLVVFGEPSFFKRPASVLYAMNARSTAVALFATSDGDVVVKLGMESLLPEACALEVLSKNGTPLIPRLISDFELPAHLCLTPSFKHGIAIAPVGAPFAPRPSREFALIVGDVARALLHAWSCGIVHRDVSVGNIVIVDQNVVVLGTQYFAGRGMLIDWNVSSRIPAPDAGQSDLPITTGTALFTSSVRGPHHISHDLESLFYSALFVATEGRLPWKHTIDVENLPLLKHGCLHNAWDTRIVPRIRSGLVAFLNALRAILIQGRSSLPTYQELPVDVAAFIHVCDSFAKSA